uniref:Uncharacterized protein n=1 Tax=Oryza meridionalis TaxID=40149 RepID=A0A0E0DL20_9ORYZ
MASPTSSASAPASHHLRLWWRRRGRGGAVGATFTVALLAAALLLGLSLYASSLPRAPTTSSSFSSNLVGLTLVRRAKEKGAERLRHGISKLAPPLGGWRLVPESEVMCFTSEIGVGFIAIHGTPD